MRSDDLYVKMTSVKSLQLGWDKVRTNLGCAGGDGETIEGFRRRSASRIKRLCTHLRRGTYRPRALRVLHIPKKSGGTRPLAIPSIEDRVAQSAVAQCLSPLLDEEFEDSSFAYRPGRSVDMAVRQVSQWRKQGYDHVVEADITRCFERIPQNQILDRLDEALSNHKGGVRVVDLVGVWLEHAATELATPGVGLPQGSPLSPVLCNLHLDQFDEEVPGKGVRLVRFADDFVLLCKGRPDAEKALERAGGMLDKLGLEMRSDKTRIVEFNRGFEFLGHLFVRSLVLKQVADPAEDAVEIMRDIGHREATEARAAKNAQAREEADRAKGYDRGERVLHVAGQRRLRRRGMSFAVDEQSGDDWRELIAVSHSRVDRIEAGTDVEMDDDLLRHALATGTSIAYLNGHGETLGWLTPPSFDRAGLHHAQARIALDPAAATDLARRIVSGRVRNQRAQLSRLNRVAGDTDVSSVISSFRRMLKKLEAADSVSAVRGHEGAATAVYWPALGRLCADIRQPFRRTRPAENPLSASINFLTFLLGRDIRGALVRRGLHPGFGVLHDGRDYHEACVYDLMEGFRAPLTEGLPVTLFNQNRIETEMFTDDPDHGVRIGREARAALIRGYETAAGRTSTSSHSGRKRTWRVIMEEEAGAYADHCRDPENMPFTAHEIGY